MQIFSKYLTETDCLKRLSVPSSVLCSFPEFHGGHAVDLLVRYENETVNWPLACTVRTIGRYKKPVISKGWRRFVLGNGLSVGDRLTFHKEEHESSSMHYRVELTRASRRSRTVPRLARASRYRKDVQVKREELKQFDLPNVDGSGLIDSSGRANDSVEQETAAVLLQHFNLVGGNTVVHDRASRNTSFYRTDQIIGQSIQGSYVDLDLTLGYPYY
ncbi:hypothetical protein V6N13_105758 [Hibiscus sabdariffa]